MGSILRTADGFGVFKVIFSGYTPYPKELNERRLPHISDKVDKQISKTALGAQHSVNWEHAEDVIQTLISLKDEGYKIGALEQTDKSVPLPEFSKRADVVLILGREVGGVEKDLLRAADFTLEIPMSGKKDSLNVASACAVALYHLRFIA